MIDLPTIADGEDKSSPFVNRIRKNYRHVRKWAKRSQTDCFRVYDREIRSYPLAIDYYAGRFCIQFFSQTRESSDPSSAFVDEVEGALKQIFGSDSGPIYWKTRAKRKETRQYEKIGESREFFEVLEYGAKFKVNLCDYLDTGLFLDHRETRRYVASLAKGKRLLNLFAYTCSFSIQAAVAGAAFTKSVDLSNTYTAWGRENFKLNGLSEKDHPVIRDDCLNFLREEVKSGFQYDLIVIDPPTISRSKKMKDLFDIQVDYIDLIQQSLKMLNPAGMVIFSTNSRRFVFDDTHFPSCMTREISSKNLPIDFHDPKIHRCWIISRFNL